MTSVPSGSGGAGPAVRRPAQARRGACPDLAPGAPDPRPRLILILALAGIEYRFDLRPEVLPGQESRAPGPGGTADSWPAWTDGDRWTLGTGAWL